MDKARDVEALSIEELRAEVWFWREGAAATLGAKMLWLEAMNDGDARRRGIKRVRKQVTTLSAQLQEALAGEYWSLFCEACGGPVKPGQAVISDVDCGEMHADCADGGWGRYKPGDKLFLEPEAIAWEGEGPKPDHIVCHASERLYTTAQLVEQLGRARAALAGAKAG